MWVEQSFQRKNVIRRRYRKILSVIYNIIIVFIEEPVVVLTQVKCIDQTVRGNIVVRGGADGQISVLVVLHKTAVKVLDNSSRRFVLGKLRVKTLWIALQRN